jgi:hypothetical protein
MGQSEFNRRLIQTKYGAVFALCSSGYVAALVFRNVLSHPQHKSEWLLDLHFLPTWGEAGVNLAFCAYLVWGIALLWRIAQGKERVFLGSCVTSFFLGLTQNLVSASAAADIEYLKALAMAVAFLTAVDIFLRMPASGYPRLHNQPSRNT